MPPPDRVPRSRPSRQQPPLSCRSCRARKLRCNRQMPCSNCVSRGIKCESSGAQPPPAQSSALSDPSSVAVAEAASRAELLQRLEQLERILSGPSFPGKGDGASHSRWEMDLGSLPGSHLPAFSTNDSNLFSAPSTMLNGQISASSILHEPYVGWLQQILPMQEAETGCGAHPVLQILPIYRSEQEDPDSHLDGRGESLSQKLENLLPPPLEAKSKLQVFSKNFNNLYHITHMPTLQTIFDHLYQHLDSPEQIPYGQILLVLSIFASATHSGPGPGANEDEVSESSTAGGEAHNLWLSISLALSERLHNTEYVTLEVLQATIILSVTVGSLEGPSHRHRCLLNQALTMARHLKLHTSDQAVPSGADSDMELELRRRVWWYLVTTDWLLASMTSSHEGTYQVNPRHMIVNLPRNLDDDDIMSEGTSSEKPDSHATTMSYFLQRLRLAKVIRTFVDRSPLTSSAPWPPSYGDVLEADVELDRFLNALPWFFRLKDSGSDDPTSDAEARNASLSMQKHLINSLAYTHRCKLHLPYLSRGFTDPTYAYSRATCLRAARSIIHSEVELDASYTSFSHTRIRSSGLLQGVYIASMALVMDVCLRGAAGQQELDRGATAHAIHILDASSRHSTAASQLLTSLTSSLRAHGLSVNDSFGLAVARQPTDFSRLQHDVGQGMPPSASGIGDAGLPTMPNQNFDDVDWNAMLEFYSN